MEAVKIDSLESSLATAYGAWLPALDKAKQLLGQGQGREALAPLSEAIRISAAYHPEYHFLESTLNVALGKLHLKEKRFDVAHEVFKRAEFLHHQNEVAMAGMDTAKAGQVITLPAYEMAARTLKAWAAKGGGEVMQTEINIFAQRAQADTVEAWEAVIALTDETHQLYHKLAAEPWFLRAKLHRELGEKELAANDQRRAEDLQPARLLMTSM